VSTVFGVHTLTIEDISEIDPREKAEIFSHYIMIVFSELAEDFYVDPVIPLTTSILLFADCIVTIRKEKTYASFQVGNLSLSLPLLPLPPLSLPLSSHLFFFPDIGSQVDRDFGKRGTTLRLDFICVS
jgi:hypothetical protein